MHGNDCGKPITIRGPIPNREEPKVISECMYGDVVSTRHYPEIEVTASFSGSWWGRVPGMAPRTGPIQIDEDEPIIGIVRLR